MGRKKLNDDEKKVRFQLTFDVDVAKALESYEDEELVNKSKILNKLAKDFLIEKGYLKR